MNCEQIKAELSAYIDGELPVRVRTELDAHLSGCASCRQRVAELQKLAAGVAGQPQLEPPAAFLNEVHRKLWSEEPVVGEMGWFDRLFRPFWLKLPIEALALVAVVATIMVFTRPPQRPEEPQMFALRRETATATIPAPAAVMPKSQTEEVAGEKIGGGVDALKEEAPAPDASLAFKDVDKKMAVADQSETRASRTAAPPAAAPAAPVSRPAEPAKAGYASKAPEGKMTATGRDVVLDGRVAGTESARKVARQSVTASKADQLAATDREQKLDQPAAPVFVGTPVPITTLAPGQSPVETVVVEAANVAEVQSRAAVLAQNLNGSLVTNQLAAGVFRVELPAANVASFKVRLMGQYELAKQRRNELSKAGHGLAANGPADTAKPVAEQSDVGGVAGSMAKSKEVGQGAISGPAGRGGKSPTVVVEIRVVKPGP